MGGPNRRAICTLLLLCATCVRSDEADDPEGLLDGESYSPKAKYTVSVSRWSECLPMDKTDRYTKGNESEGTSEPLVHTPRLGLQRRQLKCRRLGVQSDIKATVRIDEHVSKSDLYPGEKRLVRYCSEFIKHISLVRVCVVPEPCLLGEWSPWRPRPDGALVRTRRVRRLPQGGGTECSVVEEVRPAAPEPDAHWAPSAWGRCRVASDLPPTPAPTHVAQVDTNYDEDEAADNDDGFNVDAEPRCGGGVQKREASCVRPDGRALHPVHCAHAAMPTLVQPCEVPCPRDCEVSEWGPWSACQPADGCPLTPVQLLTTTGYSIRRRRVTATASRGGAPCPPLEEKRSCTAPRCAAWHAMPWGPCTLSGPRTICGPGRRGRELRCIAHDGKEVTTAWCAGSGSPAYTEPCRIACPGDCVVSAWGQWSECTASCVANGEIPIRFRRRYILAHAAPDGWPCPSDDQLTQSEPCNTHSCNTYSWFSSSWSECKAHRIDDVFIYNDTFGLDTSLEDEDDETCREEGEMTKEVKCFQNQAESVSDSLCSPLRRPPSWRMCSVRCRRPCRVEAWSPWSPCPDTCQPSKQVRVRRVHGGRDCKEARHESRACPVPSSCSAPAATWVAGPWQPCRLPPDQRCGDGYRIRSILCGSKTHRMETGACAGQPVPPAAAPCRVPCDTPPQLTCNEVCSDPLKYLDAPEPDLPQCVCANVTLEILPTDSDCILPQGMECGDGRVMRAARCLVKDLDVPMDVCRKYRPLSGSNRVHDPATEGLNYDEQFPGLLRGACTVACARDCVTDAWGEWGPCAAEAGSLAAFRFRTREVLEEGSSGGRECGATLQRATCELAAPRWQAYDWGVCAPRRALCGHALINRTVLCVGADGKPLDESACAGAGPAPPRQAACRAPCPSDCVVSAWSDWSPCEQTKWGGRRDRTRVLLRGANEGGAECPQLVEAEPCAPHLHSWHLAPWDDCQPLGGSPCGEGIKRRAVRCLRSDGVFVNDSFCPNATAMEVRESWCYVPCGVDCVLAEWSPWDASACSCDDASTLRHMRRTRQRLVAAVWPGRACPALEQRAPCPREPCMTLVATPLMACRIRTVNGSESDLACGWGTEVSEARCQLTGAGGSLQPWRCAPALPGRIVSAPLQYEEHACKVECGCGVEGIAGPWGRWGACRGGARSRTRQLLIPPRAYCRDITRYVTIEWANCTESSDVPDLVTLDDDLEKTKREWLDKDEYHDGYIERSGLSEDHHLTEGSGSLLALMWTSTIILCLYGSFVFYRGFLRFLRSRRMKTVTKV